MPPKAAKLFYLDLDMHRWVEAQAEHRRVSQAQVVRDLILEAMRAEQDSPEVPEKKAGSK
jgi:hypothetical protein